MTWELAMGVGVIKAVVLGALWYNRRRIAARLATVDMRRVARGVARELDLAPAEAERLTLHLATHERTVDELRRYNVALRRRLHDAIREDGINREVLNDLFADKRLLIEQAFVHVRDGFVDFHARLSPEQRTRLAGLLERHAAHPLFRHPLLP